MTRALLLAASVASAFSSCVSATYNMNPTDQSSGQQGQYTQGSGQDMSMGGGSNGATVVQNNVNINQNIIIIATNAGGSSQTQQMNSQIQPPAATHTVRKVSLC